MIKCQIILEKSQKRCIIIAIVIITIVILRGK